MKLYVTITSPYARLARIVVIEKGLQARVEVIEAQTRTADSPYYAVNPSGRVPFLIDDAGIEMEDSQLICAYLDSLDGKPRLHRPNPHWPADDWPYRRLEARARSFCDGLSVWVREMRRPADERSPTILAHEAARGQRMATYFEGEVRGALLQGPPTMAHLVVAVTIDFARDRGFGDLTDGRPQLAAWRRHMDTLPSLAATTARS